MDMTGYLGKKVDIICADDQELSGYVFDVLEADDSDLGVECIDLALLDSSHIVVLSVEDIKKISVDEKYIEFDFRK